MKETGFLRTQYQSLDDVRYDSAQAVSAFLVAHPGVDRIYLGCGNTVDMNPLSCITRREDSKSVEHSVALKIDISSGIAPDVLADVHDPRIWEVIPPNSMESIQDHSHGAADICKAGVRTLDFIFRSLKPGCYLAGSSWEENDLQRLKAAGFVILDDPTIVQKKFPALVAFKPKV
jgi:hypothetical protein